MGRRRANRNGCAFAHCPRLPTAKYAELPERYVSRFTLGRVKNLRIGGDPADATKVYAFMMLDYLT
jgi:hypothetical protein